MPQCTGPILLLLEIRHRELGRLLHQASPNQPHKSVRPTILTPANDLEYKKLFETTTTPVTFEPHIKTSVSTKLFVKNLLQKPRLKTKTINKVTAKSA
jgi:hypothetical protein